MEQQINTFVKFRCTADTPSDDCVNGVIKSAMIKNEEYSEWQGFQIAIGRMVANKAGLAFATRGHTALDVPLLCHTGKSMTSCHDLGFSGNRFNYEVGRPMMKAIGLNGKPETF